MTTDHDLDVAVIIASTRHGRFGPTVAAWFAARAERRRDLQIDVIDLAEARLPEVLVEPDEPLPPQVAVVAPRLAGADAFVIVTPEYNRSFPAPLKTLIDWYSEQWQAKPVAFVSYGRESGGVHAVAQLWEIFTELHAVPLRTGVRLPCYWEQFAADGRWPRASSDCDAAAEATLDLLTWWARALRDARRRQPYAA